MKLPSGIPKPVDTPSGRKYRVQYRIAGQYRTKTFDSVADAAEHQRDMKAQLIQLGKAFDIVLTPKERAQVLTILQEMEQRGTSLQKVWKFWREYHKGGVKTVEEAYKEFMAHKRQHGLSPQTILSYRNILKEFFKTIKPSTAVGLVQLVELEKWLHENTKTPGSFRKYKAHLNGFFEWCARRGYCERNIVANIESPRYEQKTPVALTAEETKRLLDYTRENTTMFPYVVIALYGGLRREEILRLTWDDFNFEEGHIVLDYKKTKTRKRRVVKLLGNAAKVLQGYTRCLIVPKNSVGKLKALQRKLGITWKRDGLRHTACAHMLNVYGSAEEASLQLGNSPEVLRTHYKAVATKAETEAFLQLL